jgi:hypothetical protein
VRVKPRINLKNLKEDIMKLIISFFLVVLGLTLPAVAAEYNLVKVKGVDNAVFMVGENSRSGYLCYIVDRTTGMCFAMNAGANGPAGLTKIDCEPLKKIEVIKTYIQTGKLP